MFLRKKERKTNANLNSPFGVIIRGCMLNYMPGNKAMRSLYEGMMEKNQPIMAGTSGPAMAKSSLYIKPGNIQQFKLIIIQALIMDKITNDIKAVKRKEHFVILDTCAIIQQIRLPHKLT